MSSARRDEQGISLLDRLVGRDRDPRATAQE
jgi:hypothetical protein